MGVKSIKGFAPFILFFLLFNIHDESDEGAYESDRGNRSPAVLEGSLYESTPEDDSNTFQENSWDEINTSQENVTQLQVEN